MIKGEPPVDPDRFSVAAKYMWDMHDKFIFPWPACQLADMYPHAPEVNMLPFSEALEAICAGDLYMQMKRPVELHDFWGLSFCLNHVPQESAGEVFLVGLTCAHTAIEDYRERYGRDFFADIPVYTKEKTLWRRSIARGNPLFQEAPDVCEA